MQFRQIEFRLTGALVAAAGLLLPAAAHADIIMNVTSVQFTAPNFGNASGTTSSAALPSSGGIQGMSAWGTGSYTPDSNTMNDSALEFLVSGDGGGSSDVFTSHNLDLSVTFTPTASSSVALLAFIDIRFQGGASYDFLIPNIISGNTYTETYTNLLTSIGQPLGTWSADVLLASNDFSAPLPNLGLTIPQGSFTMYADPATSAPEPSAFLLFGVGALCLIGGRAVRGLHRLKGESCTQ